MDTFRRHRSSDRGYAAPQQNSKFSGLRAPATNIICTRSSSSGDLSSSQRPRGASDAPVLCACAALSIAARLPCSSILSSPSCGVRTIASISPRRASAAPVGSLRVPRPSPVASPSPGRGRPCSDVATEAVELPALGGREVRVEAERVSSQPRSGAPGDSQGAPECARRAGLPDAGLHAERCRRAVFRRVEVAPRYLQRASDALVEAFAKELAPYEARARRRSATSCHPANHLALSGALCFRGAKHCRQIAL